MAERVDLHDLESDLEVALAAWKLAGKPTPPHPIVEAALDAMPENWQPPAGRRDEDGTREGAVADWWPSTDEPGEPNPAALIAEYISARQQTV